MKLANVVFVIFLGLTCISAKVPTCPDGWIKGLTKCFLIGDGMQDYDTEEWNENQVYSFCVRQDGYQGTSFQVLPTSQKENDELVQVMKSQNITDPVWLRIESKQQNDRSRKWILARSWKEQPIKWFAPNSPDGPEFDEGDYNRRGVVINPDGSWEVANVEDIYIPVCQKDWTLPEWGCFDDRKRLVKDPKEKEAMGCRSSLTCSSVNMEDGILTSGMTVNIRRGHNGAVARAEVEVLVKEDMNVAVAFTEGTSARPGECDAENLGLFLPHTSVGMNNKKLDNSIIGEAVLKAGGTTKFDIEHLQGVTSLVSLAGHGVVVCPAEHVDEVEGRMRCLSDSIPLCCKLSWVLEADQQWLGDYMRD